MDYKNFSGEAISEQAKAFSPRVCKLRKRTVCVPLTSRQGTDQSAPLSPTTDVQGLYRFHAPISTQLSKRLL